MKPHPLFVVGLVVLAVGCSVSASRPFADPRSSRGSVSKASDPGCEALTSGFHRRRVSQ